MQYLPLSIIMPVFNERETVASIAQRVLAEVPVDLELIIVDDGSTDGSAEIIDALARNDSRILAIHKTNGGKTSALKAGFERSRGEIVIIQDADLEYDPAEIPHVLQPILENHADVVYGSRFLVRRASRVLYFYHYLANKVLTLFSNALTNLNMTDVETGYKPCVATSFETWLSSPGASVSKSRSQPRSRSWTSRSMRFRSAITAVHTCKAKK